ncbi:MAG: hypothetical protein J0H11_08735 [Rhizobiales bacterium]|nr:hypothetical protein [Hyphomicrobiales bacterium]
MEARAAWAMRVAIVGLFAIYLLPLAGLTIAYLASDFFVEENALLKMFEGFTANGNDSLSVVHRALLPLMAGMAPIAFKDDASMYWSVGLMLGLLAGIAVSIFFSAAFHSGMTILALSQQSIFGLPPATGDTLNNTELTAAFKTLVPVYSFFNQTQEVMGMYLLMLFGLTLAKKA